MVKLRGVAGAGIAAVAVLALTACNPDDAAYSGKAEQYKSATPPAPAPASAPVSTVSTPAPGEGGSGGSAVFGSACESLPHGSEAGSVTAMGQQTVAAAAAANPLLTKLSAAIRNANLTDSLNNAPAVTVFAPSDDAVKAYGETKFSQLKGTELTSLLNFHVIGKRLDAKGLEAAKTSPTLATDGGQLTFSGTGNQLTVNGAKILCGNIATKNATVFVIDKVLAPASGS
ncbi:fasciclin domain-containing protein [Amycolatopsis sp. NPDC059021]|uniref:fasciclin domain-containing protein n=1 Tax=Amycolatopsis sp. NPDC059021 TaxID=3346704 RepID=UPI0036730F23